MNQRNSYDKIAKLEQTRYSDVIIVRPLTHHTNWFYSKNDNPLLGATYMRRKEANDVFAAEL